MRCDSLARDTLKTKLQNAVLGLDIGQIIKRASRFGIEHVECNKSVTFITATSPAQQDREP